MLVLHSFGTIRPIVPHPRVLTSTSLGVEVKCQGLESCLPVLIWAPSKNMSNTL